MVASLSGAGRAYLYVDPCSLTGGKDLPGTKVQIDTSKKNFTSVDTGKDGETASPFVVTLGDDTLAPRLDVKSTPARGAKVKPGDKISLKVRSYEVRSGGPWQSGVMDIQVTAEPGGLVASKDYLQYRGKACSEKSWEQNLDAIYYVPRFPPPPPIIKLCALTEDFAGDQNTKCGEFRTGNKWNGKLHLVSSITSSDYGLLCSNETFDGEFSLVVAPNGQVQGKGSAHEVGPPQCNFRYPPPAMQNGIRSERNRFRVALVCYACHGQRVRLEQVSVVVCSNRRFFEGLRYCHFSVGPIHALFYAL
jgi:hypothetical protein